MGMAAEREVVERPGCEPGDERVRVPSVALTEKARGRAPVVHRHQNAALPTRRGGFDSRPAHDGAGVNASTGSSADQNPALSTR